VTPGIGKRSGFASSGGKLFHGLPCQRTRDQQRWHRHPAAHNPGSHIGAVGRSATDAPSVLTRLAVKLATHSGIELDAPNGSNIDFRREQRQATARTSLTGESPRENGVKVMEHESSTNQSSARGDEHAQAMLFKEHWDE